MVHLERLRSWIDGLSTIPEEKFDIQSWTNSKECGTTHCVAGWLPKIFPEDWTYYGDAPVLKWPDTIPVTVYNIMSFFGLPMIEIDSIIYIESYTKEPTLSEVIARMETIYDKHSKAQTV